jgi:hypothetical protein
MKSRSLVPALGLLFLGAGAVWAEAPAAPPPPDVYDVVIRYQINAFSNERLVQYAEMMRALREAGFRRDPDEEVPENEPADAAVTRLRGTLPAAGVDRVLNQRHVRALLLLPRGAKPPEKGQPVRVDLRLASGLPLGQQQLLAQGQP